MSGVRSSPRSSLLFSSGPIFTYAGFALLSSFFLILFLEIEAETDHRLRKLIDGSYSQLLSPLQTLRGRSVDITP